MPIPLALGVALGLYGGGGITQEEDMPNYLHTAAIIIPHADILTLPSAVVDLIELGAGEVADVLDCRLTSNFASGAYTNSDSDTAIYLVVDPDNAFNVGSMAVGSDLLAAVNRTTRLPAPPWGGTGRAVANSQSGVVGKKISLGADNPNGSPGVDFEGGHVNNTLVVSLLYVKINAATGEYIPVS